MPRFEPFTGLRYTASSGTDVTSLTSPPYDVFDVEQRSAYASSDTHNIVHVDYPVESDGDGRYAHAASLLASWRREGVLTLDTVPSFYVYRMSFTDESGRSRRTVGVIGALEVVDDGAGGVLPHERTTPKAKTDRLDLTRATQCNLSPVWGLSLASGLSSLLEQPGTQVATCVDEQGVHHELERIDDSRRIAEISVLVGAADVLIADGHHRYAISRSFRDESRGTSLGSASQLTMTFVQELIETQLSVEAIHRLYDVTASGLLLALERHYETVDAGAIGPTVIADMATRGALCLVDESLRGTFLLPRRGAFPATRDLDSARLEHSLSSVPHDVRYQHGVTEVLDQLRRGDAKAAILIRPVSIDEIRRTAHTGELMPPKSTFFTPKLRTGLVIRPMT